ncbi:MAG: SUMF1/EgtB/PvdO family nonheme iron enzyme [Rhizobacter sp.]|nr:SUMF1/EgtB/PvdO family nonheme iron enzyme [Rhizobacter sp.]
MTRPLRIPPLAHAPELRTVATFVFLAYAVVACAQTPAQPASGHAAHNIDARIAALVQKTKHNLVFVKGGSFKMGDFGRLRSPERLPYTGQPEASPLHDVELDSFSIGKYKVSYEDFDVYTDANGLPRIGTAIIDARYRSQPNVPAGVRWTEAKAYCAWLATQTHLAFDLPTEAQWEYAARNRGKWVLWATDNGLYDEGRNVASYEQYREMMPGVPSPRVHPLGKFPASPLGLYDMGFNGWDWVEDWFAPDYYEHSPRRNPRGPSSGTEKVQRGIDGGAADTAITMYRNKTAPDKPTVMTEDGTRVLAERWAKDAFRCVVNEGRRID